MVTICNKRSIVFEALGYLNTTSALCSEQDIYNLVNFRAPGNLSRLELRQILQDLISWNKVEVYVPMTLAATSCGCCNNGACGGGCCGCGRYYRVKIGALM